MKIKTGLEQEYTDYKARNADPYSAAVVDYSEKWANLMEVKMS
jgi:hypothetical protein